MSYENDAYYPLTDRDDETERILNQETMIELTKHIKFLVKKSKRISKQNYCEIFLLILLFLSITGNLVLSGLLYYSRDSKGRDNFLSIRAVEGFGWFESSYKDLQGATKSACYGDWSHLLNMRIFGAPCNV